MALLLSCVCERMHFEGRLPFQWKSGRRVELDEGKVSPQECVSSWGSVTLRPFDQHFRYYFAGPTTGAVPGRRTNFAHHNADKFLHSRLLLYVLLQRYF